jgi:hypothetical protein
MRDTSHEVWWQSAFVVTQAKNAAVEDMETKAPAGRPSPVTARQQ